MRIYKPQNTLIVKLMNSKKLLLNWKMKKKYILVMKVKYKKQNLILRAL